MSAHTTIRSRPFRCLGRRRDGSFIALCLVLGLHFSVDAFLVIEQVQFLGEPQFGDEPDLLPKADLLAKPHLLPESDLFAKAYLFTEADLLAEAHDTPCDLLEDPALKLVQN